MRKEENIDWKTCEKLLQICFWDVHLSVFYERILIILLLGCVAYLTQSPINLSAGRVWLWRQLPLESQQWNPFPFSSCPPAALSLPDQSCFSTSSFHSSLWIKGLGCLFKKILDPSVQLHCCRKHSYKASGSSSGLTLQGRELSMFKDLNRVSLWKTKFSL